MLDASAAVRDRRAAWHTHVPSFMRIARSFHALSITLALASIAGAAAGGCGGGSDAGGAGASDCPADYPMTCPATVPSYAAEVAPIFANRCASCHAPGKQEGGSHPLSTYADVKREQTDVLTQLTGCRMPPDGSLQDAERKTVITWLICDAPNN